MEYKPPLDNRIIKKYRFLYCSQDTDGSWLCNRCKEKDRCETPLSNFQSTSTKLITISNDIPKIFDTWILCKNLSTSSVRIEKEM
jgi:hypothetical protein